MDAGHLCNLRSWHAGLVRVPFILLRVLEQGCDPACCLWLEHLTSALLPGRDRRVAHGLLHDPPSCYVFFGRKRKDPAPDPIAPSETAASDPHEAAHESPAAMTVPLMILAGFAVLLGFIGTPAWPWLQAFLEMRHSGVDFGQLAENGLLPLMLASSLLVFAGLTLGWWVYGSRPIKHAPKRMRWKSCSRQSSMRCGKACTSTSFMRKPFCGWHGGLRTLRTGWSDGSGAASRWWYPP